MQRLAIIVPYRNRETHLNAFVPHLRAYFTRDKADREIPYQVLVIEQDTELPFNRGALLNIGFALAENDCDYACFHDVDYLPIWADYSYVDRPTPIVWYGAEIRPIAIGRATHVVRNNLDEFYSGAVLVPKEQFRGVDGFANAYWGWGCEDVDLKFRFDAASITMGRRKGTFQALDHDNHGFELDGRPAPIAVLNRKTFDARWAPGTPRVADGLSTLDFQIMRRQSIPDLRAERAADWTIVSVRLKGEPSPEQREALASARRLQAANSDRKRRRR